jgi:hypothetical protein
MGVKGYFIQYKFILPEQIKHSSYTYQKLFRALYGYTQAVFKSNGKNYHYHRAGVLSGTPYLRPGKNCVIIPEGNFQGLLDFFKTGRNPTHAWRGKGDWKAVYYMNEKTVDEKGAIEALEALLDRYYVVTSSGRKEKIASELNTTLNKSKAGDVEKTYLKVLLNEAQNIASTDWFKNLHSQSEKLNSFYSNYKKLKAIVP